jgi:hypothetical protein
MSNTNKKKRAPGAGHPRGHTLPKTGTLVQMPPVKVTAEMLKFVRSQKEPLSDFIRGLLLEKMSTQCNSNPNPEAPNANTQNC